MFCHTAGGLQPGCESRPKHLFFFFLLAPSPPVISRPSRARPYHPGRQQQREPGGPRKPPGLGGAGLGGAGPVPARPLRGAAALLPRMQQQQQRQRQQPRPGGRPLSPPAPRSAREAARRGQPRRQARPPPPPAPLRPDASPLGVRLPRGSCRPRFRGRAMRGEAPGDPAAGGGR